MSKKKLNTAERLALELIWIQCKLISWTPFWFRYRVLAPFIYFIIYRCVGYRKGVVSSNLRNSFPEKSESEIREIEKNFYIYFAEILVSTISLARRKLRLNPQIVNKLKDVKRETNAQSWVLLTAHNGLWEYFGFWGSFIDQCIVAVYHPLGSPIFDELLKRLRTFDHVELVPLNECVRFCLKNREGIDGRPLAIGLIADQNPPLRPNSTWYKFLNQDTVFFDGGEKLAQKLSLPTYFVYQRRVSPGTYEIEYEKICDADEELESGEITRRYVERLEQVINECPYLWLWSHRRWKHKRQES